MNKLLAVGLWGFLACVVSGAGAAGTRVDIPIGQLSLPNGDIRYFVSVSIDGGPAMDADLDTGSFGFRVLKAAVESAHYQATGIRRRFSFSGGSRFNGFLARASISVGGLQTDSPILVQVIESVDCVEDQPDCPVSRVNAQDYRIAGDGYPGQGFNAIFGIAMREPAVADAAVNPLTHMGDGRWIVVLPRPGNGVGHLIINPTAEELEGFVTLQLARQGSGWADGALSGCLIDEQSKAKDCAKTLIDSGAPGFFVNSSRVSARTRVEPGRPQRLELHGGSQPISMTFTSGTDFSTRVILRPPSNPMRISAGNVPFFSYAILYDSRAGKIGFRSRGDNE